MRLPTIIKALTNSIAVESCNPVINLLAQSLYLYMNTFISRVNCITVIKRRGYSSEPQ
jgi:hypothetical protein